jgi:hypothetical protein
MAIFQIHPYPFLSIRHVRSRAIKQDDFFATTAGGGLLGVSALSSAYSAFRPLFADTDRPVLVDVALVSDIFRVIDHFDRDGDQYTIASEL